VEAGGDRVGEEERKSGGETEGEREVGGGERGKIGGGSRGRES